MMSTCGAESPGISPFLPLLQPLRIENRSRKFLFDICQVFLADFMGCQQKFYLGVCSYIVGELGFVFLPGAARNDDLCPFAVSRYGRNGLEPFGDLDNPVEPCIPCHGDVSGNANF
jgi:hypothetical protein